MYLLQILTIINHHQQTIINQQQMLTKNHKSSIEFILRLVIYLRDKQ